MLKIRPVTIQDEYVVCDFCNDEITNGSEQCSHCGKDICQKHYKKCLRGEGEDTWALCPDCSKKAKIIYTNESISDIEPECKFIYPVFVDTGKKISLGFW